MEITVKQEALKKIVSRLEKIASSAKTMPILSSILFNAKAGKVEATAFDLTSGAVSSHGEDEATVSQEGKMLLPVKQFLSFAKNVSGDVKISSAGDKAKVSSGKFHCSIPCLQADDYPKLPLDFSEFSLKKQEIDTVGLLNALSGSYASSKDSYRPTLNSVAFVSDNGILKTYATDGHRMASIVTSLSLSLEKTAIAPRQWVDAVAKLVSDSAQDKVSLYVGNDVIALGVDGSIVFSSLVSGEFPDCNPFWKVAGDLKSIVEIDKDEIRQALKVATAMSSDKPIVLECSGEELEMKFTSETSDGAGSVHVNGGKNQNEFKVGINPILLSEAIERIPSQKVILCQDDDESPLYLFGDSEKLTANHLVMPVRLS